MPEPLTDFLQHEPLVLGTLAFLLLSVLALVLWLSKQRRARRDLSAELIELEHARAIDQQRNEQSEETMAEQRALREQAEADRERWRGQATTLENRVASLESESRGQRQKICELEDDRATRQARFDETSRELSETKMTLREQEVTLEKERRATTEKLELLERNRDALKQEFENLANKIFEQKSERFSQQTRTSLDTLLNPFRDQLQDFRKRVEDVYTSETRDRQALRSEIKSLQELNKQITEEASNLTRALKGDKKIQGNWGEVILERVLERSGLRKGIEDRKSVV